MSRDLLASTDDVLLEPPRAVRPAAFRRLGLVAFAAAYRLVAALLIAGPFAVLLSGAVAGDPRGDAVLFDPGALMLFEALRLSARGAAGAGSASGMIVLLTTFLGLLPFAALVAGLGRQGRLSLAYLAARAVQPIGTLALLWGVGLVAQVVFAGVVGLLGARAVERLHLATPGDDLGGVVVVALALLVVLAVGIVRDIAAVAAVNDGSRFYNSTARALQIMWRAGGRALWAYAWRGLLAIAAIGAAWMAVSALGRGAPPRAAISFLIHQAAIVITVFLHASWLAAAIRLLDQAAPLADADVVDAAFAPVAVPVAATATEAATAIEAEAATVTAAEAAIAAVTAAATEAATEAATATATEAATEAATATEAAIATATVTASATVTATVTALVPATASAPALEEPSPEAPPRASTPPEGGAR